MRRIAVLIGTGDYRDDSYPDLRSPKADVAAIEAALKNNGHFDERKVLHDPTFAQATETLEEVLDEGRPDDLVFISISGHGVKNKRGRLHLAFHDTRPHRLTSTALSSDTLHRMLEESRVNSKVLLLDCCYSGAFADGFTTRSNDDADAIDFEREIKGQGTYVLAASGALEVAHEGENTRRATPSPFSAAVARGLSGEAPDANGDGWIDTQDLYQAVHREVDSIGRQRVTGFALELQGSTRLARHVSSLTATRVSGGPSQRTPEAAPISPRDTEGQRDRDKPGGGELEDIRAGRRRDPNAPWDVTQWTSLFSYYRSCLTRQEVLQQLPDVSGKQLAPCAMDSEMLLSGAAERWRATGKALELASRAKKDGQALRYGYPAVLFDAGRADKGGKRDWKIAPLIAMDVEPVDDDNGRCLVPVDEPALNSQVLLSAAELNPEELDELLTWFQADWGSMGVAGLGDKARSVCDRLGLARVHDLVPGELRTELDLARPYSPGAQNAAVLHRVDRAATAVKQLVSDLDTESRYGIKPDRVPDTALAALSGQRGSAVRPRPYHPVITGNSNPAQEEILHSAMTERLTVATGAPGTGKSELITSVVTTAVAAGDSVLVASTNNTAVDEVVGRANRLVPGADLVVRTGNAEERQREPDILTELRAADFGRVDVPTAAERLADHERRISRAGATLDGIAAAEHRLAVLAPVRRRDSARLPGGLSPESFPDADAVRRWATRAEKALERRWSGWWHRWRIRRGLNIEATVEELTALLRFLVTELDWREARGTLAGRPAPEAVHGSIAAVRKERRGDSSDYLLGRVAEALGAGRDLIDARLQALASGGSSWKGIPKLLGSVRAWATTSRSVRGVLPPNPGLFDLVVVDEASQCTVADLVPLLYRAKRALVIGDPHQLQPVNSLDYREDSRYQVESGLNEQWLDDRSLVYTRSSAYHAAASGLAAGGGEVLWLDEHYRCHPDIVTPVNRRFYGDRLAVRTRIGNLAAPADPALEWIDVQGEPDRPGGFSCRNKDEVERVIALLRELWTELPGEAKIGVVTPFTRQMRELKARLDGRTGDRIRVGTVHTFQGGERDVVVISPTAATGVDKRPGNWAVRQQNLWNVAVTRARSRLYVVGDRGHWAEREGLLADLAREEAVGAGAHAAGDDARTALFGALRDRGAEPTAGTRVAGYHCDLSVPTPTGGTAVLIDRSGIDEPSAPALGRGLHRALDRAALFEEVSGMRTMRVPMWRCLAEPAEVADEILATP